MTKTYKYYVSYFLILPFVLCFKKHKHPLTILSIQFSIVNMFTLFIRLRTFSSCKTKTLYILSMNPSHHPLLVCFFYESDWKRQEWNHTAFAFLWLAFSLSLTVLKVPYSRLFLYKMWEAKGGGGTTELRVLGWTSSTTLAFSSLQLTPVKPVPFSNEL